LIECRAVAKRGCVCITGKGVRRFSQGRRGAKHSKGETEGWGFNTEDTEKRRARRGDARAEHGVRVRRTHGTWEPGIKAKKRRVIYALREGRMAWRGFDSRRPRATIRSANDAPRKTIRGANSALRRPVRSANDAPRATIRGAKGALPSGSATLGTNEPEWLGSRDPPTRATGRQLKVKS
jgi:hypothetical protein